MFKICFSEDFERVLEHETRFWEHKPKPCFNLFCKFAANCKNTYFGLEK